jgi:hypothetical protein
MVIVTHNMQPAARWPISRGFFFWAKLIEYDETDVISQESFRKETGRLHYGEIRVGSGLRFIHGMRWLAEIRPLGGGHNPCAILRLNSKN